jgi:hypothetical protein
VVRTRMPGGVGGVASRGVPLSRSSTSSGRSGARHGSHGGESGPMVGHRADKDRVDAGTMMKRQCERVEREQINHRGISSRSLATSDVHDMTSFNRAFRRWTARPSDMRSERLLSAPPGRSVLLRARFLLEEAIAVRTPDHGLASRLGSRLGSSLHQERAQRAPPTSLDRQRW